MPYVKAKDGVDIYYETPDRDTFFVSERDRLRRRSVEYLSGSGVFPRSSRGHSRLSWHRPVRQTLDKYSTDMFAADAAAVLDHLDIDGVVVCGHSMGGRVAQLLALDYPDKVSTLILASSGAAHPGDRVFP